MGLRAAALMAAWVLGGCFGPESSNDPIVDIPIEGTWIQTRVEFHKQTANGLSPLPVFYTVVDGDTTRSHTVPMDTVIGSFFEFWHEALVRIDEGKVVRQGAFGHWALGLDWNHGTNFEGRDSTSFVKLNGSKRLLNGTDTVFCTRFGTELKLQFQGAAGLSDSIVVIAYYKPYTGAFPAPEFPFSLLDGEIGGLDSILSDTGLQHEINQKILDLQSGLGSLEDLLQQFGINDTTDTASTGPVGEIAFYQFGDHKDNDGDGCLDEEIIDSLDNDLDGFVDEDARVTVADGVDNDHKNGADEAAENLAGTLLSPQAPYLLTFVALSGQGESWVKIKKDAANMDVRLRIQKDSLFLPSRALLPNYAAKIDSAKTLVGGCWRNYP
jgi:hypothetical protein